MTSSAVLMPAPARPHPPIAAGRVAAFLLLATAISTALAVPLALGVLPASAIALVVPIAQLAPLVAALLVRDRSVRGSFALAVPSARRLGLGALLALLAFTLVPAAGVILGLALGAPTLSGPGLPVILMAVPAVLVMQAVFAIGEELSWRGWLQSTLGDLGFWPMSLLIGVMWAAWHLPVVLALGMGPREVVSYLGTIVAVAPLLSALREVSGTVWVAVFAHGLLNSLRVAIAQNVIGPLEPGMAWALDAAGWVLWLLAAWLVRRVGWSRRPGATTIATT